MNRTPFLCIVRTSQCYVPKSEQVVVVLGVGLYAQLVRLRPVLLLVGVHNLFHTYANHGILFKNSSVIYYGSCN
jgi:hypothetical protein